MAAARIDVDKVLRAAGLDRVVLSQSEGFIPTAAFALVLEEAARASGDNCFGLHFGERFEPKDIGALTYVVLNSPTVGAAMQDAHPLRSHSQSRRDGVVERGWVSADISATRSADRRSSHAVITTEFSMTVALKVLRVIAGPQWIPHEVQFAHRAPGRPRSMSGSSAVSADSLARSTRSCSNEDLLERPGSDRRSAGCTAF